MKTFLFLSVSLLMSIPQLAWAQDTSILWDPGPRYRCYSVVEEHYGEPFGFKANPLKETAECTPFLIPAREDENCRGFGAIMPPNKATCPTWKFSTVGWYYQKTQNGPSDFQANPGYDVGVTGGNGSPITARLVNKAYAAPDCNLREVAFTYEYPASSFIKFRPSGGDYSLDDAQQFIVSYELTIQNSSTFKCPQQKRNIVTTDFIYDYRDGTGAWKKNVLSVVHFDPQKAFGPNSEGVYWNPPPTDEGCRLMVAGPQVSAGTPQSIQLDFKELVRRYSSKLCHPGGVPVDTRVHAIQIVSSNVGSDSSVEVKNIQAVFRNPPPPKACQVRYRVTNQWDTGYTADIEITNQGAPLNGWTLNWTLPGADVVTDRWNTTLTQSGRSLSATQGQWNGSIPTNGTVTFGFNANVSGTPSIPTAVTLNGTNCRVN